MNLLNFDIAQTKEDLFSKTMDDQQYNAYLTMHNLPMPGKEFNDSGLRFSLDHLKAISLNVILFPVQHAAQYVDVITMEAVKRNDPDYNRAQIPSIKDAIIRFTGRTIADLLPQISATGIGNFAYIGLYASNEQLKYLCQELFFEIYKIVTKEVVAARNLQKS